jgi:hypothetical protein
MDRLADTLRRCVSRIEDLEQFKEIMESPEGMDFSSACLN